MKAVASPFHQKLKFPYPNGVVVVRGKLEDSRYCFNLAVQGAISEKPSPLELSQIVAVVEKLKVGKNTMENGEYSSAKGKEKE